AGRERGGRASRPAPKGQKKSALFGPYIFATGSRFKCGETNQDLYRIFMTGVDGTPMPSFADVIQPNDAWDLVHFLRTLQTMPTPELDIWKKYSSEHASEIKPIGPVPARGGNKTLRGNNQRI